jgi:hypothetical protein
MLMLAVAYQAAPSQGRQHVERITAGVAVHQQPAAVAIAKGEAWISIRMDNASDHPLLAGLPAAKRATNRFRGGHVKRCPPMY